MNSAAVEKGIRCILVITAIGYVTQCFTPLRLTPDALEYLSIADAAAHGKGFTYRGEPTSFPPGYPSLVALMILTGTARTPLLNLLNVIGAAAGLWAAKTLAEMRGLPRGWAWGAAAACALSFALIKHAAIPLTDTLFFGVSVNSVLSLEMAGRTTGRSSALWWALGILLVMTSIFLRLAGIALIGTVLIEAWRNMRRRYNFANIQVLALVTTLGTAAGVAMIRWAQRPSATSGTPVLRELGVYSHNPASAAARTVAGHAIELGQIFFNVPESRLPSVFVPVLLALGAAAIFAVTLSLLRSRAKWSPSRTFATFYGLMVMFWPMLPGQGGEPRFWLPMLPIMLAEFLCMSRASWTNSQTLRILGTAYATWFAVVGFFALAYSAHLTFSPSAFLRSPSTDTWRPEYQAWLSNETQTQGPVDSQVMHILYEYGGIR